MPSPMSSAVGSPLPAFEMAADHNGLILQNGVRVVVRSEFYVSDPVVLDTLTMHSPALHEGLAASLA